MNNKYITFPVPTNIGNKKSTHPLEHIASHFCLKPKEPSPLYRLLLLKKMSMKNLILTDILSSKPATNCLKHNCLQIRYHVRQGKKNA